ncbi:SpoIIE family protein phosphatase [Streptomyces griseiscabiei]|uniref:SpoIIE family protein phosphatase n=2 Tax=Streptomyces griseiscabiei TaxID=2993540 RepID=A0ABU4L6H5_9ACTN|nr:SpoIIE family protein phosphatase [Streptomyces griseiscabiei]MBZ3906228.1 SpoIIE family protein phosphatase [Streptomyces griseiscabiei]MDX2911223.1 SpoIIE family protein phosphatase [Streptomyces griseiscabiei]
MEQPNPPEAAETFSPDDRFDEVATARATMDEHGSVTGWREGARRLLGYSSAEVVGRPAVHLLDQALPAERVSELHDLPRWSGTVALRHRDGHRVETRLLAHHRPGADTGPEWFVVSPLDEASGPWDESLGVWAFEQTPCALGVHDIRMRRRRANRAAERATSLPESEWRGLRVSEMAPHLSSDRLERAMARTLETGEPQYLEAYGRVPGESREHAWSQQTFPVRDPDGVMRGVGVTAHDITEQYWARKRLQTLNDASVRIGSTLDVARTAAELSDVTVPEFADLVVVSLLPDLDAAEATGPSSEGSGTHPRRPVRLRLVARRPEIPGAPEPVFALGDVVSYSGDSATARCLATGRSVLRARYDASLLGNALLEAEVRALGVHSVMAVPLRARGATLGVTVLVRHRTPDPFDRDDLLLAEEISARAAVAIDNARRYTRERDTAATLQRTLLPQRLPRPAAMDVAYRYLPAHGPGGAGGDWFDVIPLSSARVALVVGDVVGHGIQASAAMGRLRTAVRTLADVDLAPDELLTHLDDLVVRLSADADGSTPDDQAAELAGGFGSTCLYAVYDPVSRVCTLASAGHPGPAVVSPDGTVDILELPVGPPLGLGDLPFETTSVTLPEGSVIALYTDGLIDTPDHDLAKGLTRLRASLARPATDLDDLCDRMLAALPPTDRHTDDIALLTARTRVLDPGHVATWDLPGAPAIVSKARKLVSARLGDWGLQEDSFVTELLVSELVTNAIRHASPPIRLRLIYEHHLTCEVSDGSSTAPHLRRARAHDEGGRGLLLVARLSRGWGTRHTRDGKTIWAETAVSRTPAET